MLQTLMSVLCLLRQMRHVHFELVEVDVVVVGLDALGCVQAENLEKLELKIDSNNLFLSIFFLK